MNSEKYIGLDVHQATISVAVMDSKGRRLLSNQHARADGSGLLGGLFDEMKDNDVAALKQSSQTGSLFRLIPEAEPASLEASALPILRSESILQNWRSTVRRD